jgi:F-type H+-transporting ATPase subunit gamma
MGKARKIKRRADAVRSVRTITRTMEMMASSRYRRAYDLVTAARPHTDRLTDVVGDVMRRGGPRDFDHPLLHAPPGVTRELLLVLTSNRGLCGGYNSRVLDVALHRRAQLVDAGYQVLVWVSGKRGISQLAFRGFHVDRALTEFGYHPDYAHVGALAEEMMSMMSDGRISGLEVAYMQHLARGAKGSQAGASGPAPARPVIAQMLPMEDIEPPPLPAGAGLGVAACEFLPSAEDVMRRLLPATCRMRLWQCFLDAGVSEQAMRMSAMRAATDNADEMIHDLTVQYNRKRQAGITAELADMAGVWEASP